MSDTPEPLADILAEARCKYTASHILVLLDRIEAAAEREARAREQAAADYALKRGEDIHADRCRNCTERAPGNAVPRRFDEAAFDAAVAKPNGWSNVADPVAEIRKMRGDEQSVNAAAMREALEGIDGDCRVLDRKDMWEEEGECYYEALRDIREKVSAALAAPARNCERFNSWEDAYIAWVKDTQECEEYPIDWGELPGDAYEAAEELWIHYFADDQNREFCDWLWKWEEAK